MNTTFKFFFAIFAILFLTVRADDVDPCLSLPSTVDMSDAAARQSVYACFRAIHPLTEDIRTRFLDSLQLMLDGYAFVHDLKAPEDPRFALQNGVDTTVDMEAELADMRTREYPSAWELMLHAERTWALARDAHNHVSLPSCYSYIQNIIPVVLEIAGVDEATNTLKIQISTSNTQVGASYLRAAGIDEAKVYGQQVAKINGVAADDFVQDWADNRALTGRDPAQRLELFMERSGGNQPDILALATGKAKIADWSNFEGEDAVFKFTYEMTNGYTFSVPVLGLMPSRIIFKATPVSSEYLRNTLCPVTKAKNHAELALEKVEFDAVAFATEISMPVTPVTAATRAITRPAREFSSAKLARIAPKLLARGVREVEAFRAAVATNKHYAHAAAASATAPLTANEGQYIDVNVSDEVCVFYVDTYAPDGNDGMFQWLRELDAAMEASASHGCGVTRPIVFDYRSNGGGAVVLLDLLFTAIWPHYTPHHTTNNIFRLNSAVVDTYEELLQDDSTAVRMPYSFHGHQACDFKTVANCPHWWKHPRAHVYRALGGEMKAFGTAAAVSDVFWEKPEEFESIEDWAENGNANEVIGEENVMWASFAEELAAKHKWSPRPDLTTFVFGPFSASCTGHTAGRARSFNLGTVVTVGGNPKLEGWGRLMAAMVPGGNVIGAVGTFESAGVVFPIRGTDVAITSSGSTPYVQETSLISPYTSPYTTMEFVYLPPQLSVPLWEPHSNRHTPAGRANLVAALKKPGMPLAGCIEGTFNWASYEECPVSEGVRIAGRMCDAATGKYTGECVPALCEFGWERFNGKCVNHGVKINSLPEFHGLPPRPAPTPVPTPTPVTKLDAWVLPVVAVLAVIALAAVAGLVFVVLSARKSKKYAPLLGADEP